MPMSIAPRYRMMMLHQTSSSSPNSKYSARSLCNDRVICVQCRATRVKRFDDFGERNTWRRALHNRVHLRFVPTLDERFEIRSRLVRILTRRPKAHE